MVLSFDRLTDRIPGSQLGTRIKAHHFNDLQESLEGVRNDPLGDASGTLPAVLTDLRASADRADSRVVDVEIEGALGDGATDDRAAIQQAIDKAITAGGGVVWFPRPVTYLVSSVVSTSHSVDYALLVAGDNITFAGVPGAVLKFTGTSSDYIWYIAVSGPAKAGSFNDIFTNRYIDGTIRTMTAASTGDTSVTLATPAHAADFDPGDWCCVMTGQTIPADNAQPDAEINQIVSADAGTGALALRWPLSKPYAQEYYVSGTTGLTTTSSTANLARFGVANGSGNTVVKFGMRDLRIEQNGETFAAIMQLQQVAGAKIENVTYDITCDFVQSVGSRDVTATKVEGVHSVVDRGTPVAPSCICSDWLVSDCAFTSSDSLCLVHSHEGVANFSFIRNTLKSKYVTGSGWSPINVSARAYNNLFDFNTIIGGGDEVVSIGDDCPDGGRISYNRIIASESHTAIKVSSPGWYVGSNDIVGVIHADPTQLVQFFTSGIQQPVNALTGWVKFDDQDILLGTIPGPFSVIGISLAVIFNAFDSDGTDRISVGVTGDTQRFGTLTDVSSLGVKTVSPGTGFGYYNTLPSEIRATYVNGGSEPTQGWAVVTVQYVHPPWLT